MSKLFVFGDSFSAHYDLQAKHFIDYHKFLNGEPFPKIWPVLLSEKLNMELQTTGIGGACNYTIFEEFSKHSHKINEDDVVIIGWTYLERFRVFDPINKTFRTCVPNFKDIRKIKNMSDETIEEMLINRSYSYWLKEVRNWENLIVRLQSFVKFKLIIWSFDIRHSKIPHFDLHHVLGSMGAETIIQETNNIVNDGHYGKMGHIKQAEYFYEKINQMDSSNYIKL